MRTTIWAALSLAMACTLPAACSEGEPPAAEAPEGPDGVAVSNARLMLPAVAGNPAAVYFDIANLGERDVMIRAVNVAGASGATLHEMAENYGQMNMNELFQLGIKSGETVEFKPGGLHVMANDLADDLAAGDETEVTLTFLGGDKISFPAEIRAAGDER